MLRRAVIAAAARGTLSPSTQHLLIALGEQELTARILAELGVSSAHRALTTGHVLLAILERHAYVSSELISSLPDIREITTAVISAPPGAEG